MAQNTITLTEVKNLINYTIDNNIKRSEEGKIPIAVSIEATAGIGKTSILLQIAKERGMGVAKVSMHEMEEAGDLLGYPQMEYECQIAKKIQKEDGTKVLQVLPKTAWFNAKQMEEQSKTIQIRQTGKTRMGYAKPAWVPEYNPNGTMVILDDYVRAQPQILQACMELILTQKNMSWQLPAKTTICLTNNPDDGSNNVSSLDEAQRTRFLNYQISWSADAWVSWAEKEGVDSRCINFVLSYADELFNDDGEGNRICNPRSFMMFVDMISSLKNWEDKDTMQFIYTIAKGCFNDENGKFANMFSSFIRNKMHLLPHPKQMLTNKWDSVKENLEKAIWDCDTVYRPDIAALLERRFANYVGVWLESDEKTPITTVKDRLLDFITTEEKGGKKLFNHDLLHHMIKTITSDHRQQTSKLLTDPRIMSVLA